MHCEMNDACKAAVTHIDAKGYVYCTTHGEQRKTYQRCRKLRPHEMARLARGEQVQKY